MDNRRLRFLQDKEAQVGRAGMSKSEIQELVDEGTGQNKSVGDLVSDATDSMKQAILPKEAAPAPDLSAYRLYNSPEEKRQYDQKFKDALAKVPQKQNYNDIMNNVQQDKDEQEQYKNLLNQFPGMNEAQSSPDMSLNTEIQRRKLENEQAAKKAALQQLALKQFNNK